MKFIRKVGLVYGLVKDTEGNPVGDADVIFDENNHVKTDMDGYFILKMMLPPDKTKIKIKTVKEGYRIAVSPYDLEKSDIIVITLIQK